MVKSLGYLFGMVEGDLGDAKLKDQDRWHDTLNGNLEGLKWCSNMP